MSEQTTPATSWLPRPFAVPADVPALPWPATLAASCLLPPTPGEAPRGATGRLMRTPHPVRVGSPKWTYRDHGLTKARLARRLSSRELSRRVGLFDSAVSNWLDNNHIPERHVESVARLLDTDPATVRSWFDAA